jgi:hypothetical protein
LLFWWCCVFPLRSTVKSLKKKRPFVFLFEGF